jgi:acetoacetate decarboxylase
MSAARRPRPENPAVSTVRLTATGLPRSPAARAVCHALNKKRISVEGMGSPATTTRTREQAMCDVARLPRRDVVAASHFVTDLTLGLGEVVFAYLKDS